MKKGMLIYGRGIVLQKFTGHRGKYDQVMPALNFGEVRQSFNDTNNLANRRARKVDEGGGGTIAQ